MSIVQIEDEKKVINIQILLATYNGEKYLDEQLESLISQTRAPDKIIVSDDNSKDSTWEKLLKWQASYPLLFEVHKNESKRHGHCGNFANLCELAKKGEGDYFLFSDQDDVWHKNKIERLLKVSNQEQANLPASEPYLIHSDLKVVNEDLEEMSPSFFNFQGLPRPEQLTFPRFLIQNNVTGCASFFNRALLEKASPIPSGITNHDWWFGLVAYKFGKLVFLEESLISYRQHSANALGAEKKGRALSFTMIKKLFALKQHFRNSHTQARCLLDIKGSPKSLEHQEAVLNFVELPKQSLSSKAKICKRLANNPNSWLELLVFFSVVLTLR